MKVWLLFLRCVMAAGFVFFGCGPDLVQPAGYEQLKSEYIALAETLKHEVESFRGRAFTRPVTTAVYTLEEYKTVISRSTGSPYTAAQKKMFNDIFKAEGLLRRDADYFGEQDSMLANETGGFYKDGSDSIYVILDEKAPHLDYDDEITIFHELIHALQDQNIGLTTLSNSVSTSDQGNGVLYALEGEAELLSIYFYYMIATGDYPVSSAPVMTYFDTAAAEVNNVLDSMHNAGDPLFLKQPFYWAYYSYGPRFINDVAGKNWSLIDANVYPRLPIKTRAVLHPETFSTEYSLDFNRVYDFLDSAQVVYGDADELGEVLMNVLFREWDFADYRELSSGLLADNIVAYRTPVSDSVRIAWYTCWSDAEKSAAFFRNIAFLISAKRNSTLPAATQQGDTSVVNDTLNKVYIESSAGHVFVLEDYQRDQLQELIARMRGVKWYLSGAMAKSAARSRRYPFIDKSKLAKDERRRDLVSTCRVR